MKKIFYSLLIAGCGLCLTVACDEDRDSNPTINQDVSSFVLNTPSNAVNIYDLENSSAVVLTTTQPDYGIPVAVTYQPSISLNGTDFKTLPTTYTTTTISIDANEVNNAVLDLAGDADLSSPISVSFKLSATVVGMPVIESNVVELPHVLAYVPVVEISLPTEFYFVGSYKGSEWSTFTPMHQAYSVDGMFYAIIPFEQGSNFKISPKNGWGSDMGYGASAVTLDGELAQGVTSSDDGNFIFNGETGLYTAVIKAKIANGSLAYTMSFTPASIYVYGACEPTGLAAWAADDANKFTDNGDGTATSPALGGDGELRLAVDCGTDWWKTEFTIMTDGTLFYRNCDIPNNWADNIGADYSFAGVSGKTIILDFTSASGSGKME